MQPARLALPCAALLALAACGPTREATPVPSPGRADALVDPISRALLDAYGQAPAGATIVSQVTVGDTAELPWALYLEVSRLVGLDFAALEGAGAELRETPVAGWAPDARAYVLVRAGEAIGAWIGPGGNSSGVLPLSARP